MLTKILFKIVKIFIHDPKRKLTDEQKEKAWKKFIEFCKAVKIEKVEVHYDA